MRVCAGLLALLMTTSGCSGGDSPRRERRHHERRHREQTPADDIRAVIEMNRADDVGRREVHETLGDVEDMLQQVAPPDAHRGIGLMFADLEDEIDAVDVTAVTADVYARHLSADDARALREFYETPAGRRIAAANPDIAEDLSDEADRIGEQIGERIASRVQSGEYSGLGAARESRRERRRRLRGED